MNDYDKSHCIYCHTDLVWAIDADPNGEMDCVCKRCQAEQDHDFDLEPDVQFDRCGNVVDTQNVLSLRVSTKITELIYDLRKRYRQKNNKKISEIYIPSTWNISFNSKKGVVDLDTEKHLTIYGVVIKRQEYDDIRIIFSDGSYVTDNIKYLFSVNEL